MRDVAAANPDVLVHMLSFLRIPRHNTSQGKIEQNSNDRQAGQDVGQGEMGLVVR